MDSSSYDNSSRAAWLADSSAHHAPLTYDRPLSTPVLGEAVGDGFLAILGILLVGYAMLGKSVAYLGAPPLYVGEIVLALGLLAMGCLHQRRAVTTIPFLGLLLLMMAWGAARTIPYLRHYGMDALRDAATWGYAGFAIIVASLLIERPSRLALLLGRYRRFALAFLLLLPALRGIPMLAGGAMPHSPWAPDQPIIFMRSGDNLVHLAGVMALAVGFGVGGLLTSFVVGAEAIVLGVNARGGFVAFLMALAVCIILRPTSRWIGGLLALFVGAVLLMGLLRVQIELPDTDRAISLYQMVSNFRSIASDPGLGNLAATREFRVNWWLTIVDYTFYGDYFWQGKGFGVNLADDDGFQVYSDGSLRSPHNTHMGMLARTGVPGLALWLAVQLTWAWKILRLHLHSRRSGRARWAGLFLFLFIYWLAFTINTSFDVCLEGPMGGIWFWTIFGVGLAAMSLYNTHPECLEPDANPARA